MVPEVGHSSSNEVRASIEAMAELTRRIIASGATTIVLISPHAPLDPEAFVAYGGPFLNGDFSKFRAPHLALEATVDLELLAAIEARAVNVNLDLIAIADNRIDHGTSVPLYFFLRNGWKGKVVALGYSFNSNDDHLRFGKCIKEAIDAIGRPVALIASGDLSHRLKPDAPAGYAPTAYLFDEQVVEAIETNAAARIVDIDASLRKVAGECGYRSMLIALGATAEMTPRGQVLHYEAPFGVGYLVAQLTCEDRFHNESLADDVNVLADLPNDDESRTLPAIARKIVETYTLTGSVFRPEPTECSLLGVRAACFVSIKTLDGDLRGCIGTIEPTKDTLAEELVANAISAATRDPRFSPIEPSELANLRYSVDVLSAPEPARVEDLNPSVYGVVVEDESGENRGLLLPDIEGVETAAQQVEIATRKAGIPKGRPLRISRFRVNRYRE